MIGIRIHVDECWRIGGGWDREVDGQQNQRLQRFSKQIDLSVNDELAWGAFVVHTAAMHLPHRLLALALSLTATFACEKHKPEDVSLTVTLNEAGAQPQQTLRLEPTQGLKETMSMTMKMDMHMSGIPKTDVPAMVMNMDFEVGEIEPNGNIHSQFTLSEADVVADLTIKPSVKEAVRGSLKELIGLSGTQVIDNRGFVIDATMKIPPGVAPQTRQMMEGMRNSMEQLMAPLPAEAVGVGAKWTTMMPLTMNGMTLVQEANYTVTAIKGKLVTATVTLKQTAKAQTIKQPNMPPVKLLSLESSGSGQITFDMTKLVPTSSMQMTSQSELEAAGQSIDMTVTIDVGIQPIGLD